MIDIDVDAGEGIQWKNPETEYFFSSWSKRSKIFAIVVAILLVIVAFQVLVPNNIGTEVHTIIQEVPVVAIGFHQVLYSEGDGNEEFPEFNFVVFPYFLIALQTDTSPESIFDSVIDEIDWVFTYNEITTLYDFWENGEGGIITNIEPYRIYYIHVNNNCNLTISCWEG